MNTRKSLFRAALAGALATGLLPTAMSGTASAQPPSVLQPFTTQIFIQNPNSAAATVVVQFYSEGTGVLQTPASNITLNPNGSTTVFVGSLFPSSFQGSAVISADQPVVAASMQVPSATTGYGHMMANAFTSAEASSAIFLSTFLGDGNATKSATLFGVQNTEAEPINIRARFFNLAGAVVFTSNVALPAFASKFFDGYNYTTTIAVTFPHAFDGSVVVTATKQSNGQPAGIVGIAEERRFEPVDNTRFRASAFEALPQSAAATTVYLPTALCRFGTGLVTTFFAIQNTGSSPASVSVTYAAGAGTTPPVQTNSSLAAFAKWSVNPCQGLSPSQDYSGAAVVQSTQPVVVVVKPSQTDPAFPFPRYVAAFNGQATGSRRVAFPLVRWSPSPGTDFRTNISIQNVGTAPINSGDLKVFYYSQDGTLYNDCTSILALPPGAKLNSNAVSAFFDAQFSCTFNPVDEGASTTFTGNAVVVGPVGAQLIAVARTSPPGVSAVSVHTEDFSGILLP
ncbi:MAG: DUF5719 family protein [Anaerolineae bacterium]|nr:DUF5719 family protein [Anaerolineae bacterium]